MSTGSAPVTFMARALAQARLAGESGEVPVGAVLVLRGGEMFEGHNRAEAGSPLRHAEVEVLEAALAARGRDRLEGAVLYVTAEPCLMCLGSLVLCRVGGLVYGCEEPRYGGVAFLREMWGQGRYPHRFPIASGIHAEEARELLVDFFRSLRR